MATTTPWVLITHPEYNARQHRDMYTDDHYTGAAREKARQAARNLRDTVIRDDKGFIKDIRRKGSEMYLWRRAQGESTDNYVERAMISKFPMHTAAVVNSFVGSIFSVEGKADRIWSPSFGDPEDPASPAYRLMKNADGAGTNWATLWKKAAVQFTLYGRVWYLVEDDRVMLLHPGNVRNWRAENGRPVEVLVEEEKDLRTSIRDEPAAERRFVLYTLDGYERYRLDEERNEVELLADESGKWKYPHYDSTDDGALEVLPIGYIDLPIASHPGYNMAQGNNHLYNLLSDVRNTLRIANHAKLAGDVDDEQFEFTQTQLQAGSNMLQGPWTFIGPPAENAAVAYEIYKQEVREFYATSHQRYNDAAREVTATEARQDEQSGRQSFLVLLSGALDELEARCMFLLSQKQFPTTRRVWDEFMVARSTDFAPVDGSDFAERLMRRYFDGPVPIGATGQANAAKIIAGLDGVPIEEGEVDAAADDLATGVAQASAAEDELRALLNA